MAESKDNEFKHLNIPLNGKLRTSIDGTQLGPGDFQVLKNMRYGELSPKSITGMTQINTSLINTYTVPFAGAFHFRKSNPVESHILAQQTGAYGILEHITGACKYIMSPMMAVHGSAAGAGEVSIKCGAACAWTAATNAGIWDWVSLTPASGTGNGTVTYTFLANNAEGAVTRAGYITVGSEVFWIVQTATSAQTLEGVFENTTDIPNAGDFTSSLVWTDTHDYGIPTGKGRFSDAPDGCVAYANGKSACIWGGVETRCSGFVIGDLDGDVQADYTLKINNTLSDAANIATMQSVAETIDANTMLLLSLDNNITDTSPTTAHTITNSNVTFVNTASLYKWGYSGLFNGTNANLDTPDNADFDLSGGTWSIDTWIYIPTGASGTMTLYFQKTGSADYFWINLTASGSLWRVNLSIVATTEVVGLSSSYVISQDVLHHIEITENGDDYYIFIDGVLQGYVSDADRAANYATYKVYIGCSIVTGTTKANFLNAYLDEFRVSNVARHTTNFSPRSNAYGNQSTCYLYVASVRPIKGVKFYIGTANAGASSFTVYEWKNGNWSEIASPVDGTDVSTATLAQTGWITFTDTVTTSKPKVYNDTYCYWYLFTFIGLDATTTVSHATLSTSFQNVVDLWDNEYRPTASFFKYTTKWIDNSTNVLDEDWLAPAVDDTSAMSGSLTYSQVGALTSIQYLLVGFVERMTGIRLKFVQAGFGSASIDRTNTVACTMTVQYWDGDGWTTVTGLDDGTRQGSAAFGKSGVITWDAPTENTEFKYSVKKNVDHYFYYKISFSATLSALVYIDKISGIPAQKYINGYSFPAMWQNRLWYFDEVRNKRNSAICTSQDTVCVFNGQDAIPPDGPMLFGNDEEVVCAESLYTRYGGTMGDNLVVYKANEVWVIDGTSPIDYRKFKMGDSGCVAPGTLRKCNAGYEMAPGLMHHVHIFQSDHGIHINDGNTIQTISGDIDNYFDRTKSECINPDMIEKSESFFDEVLFEYHWLFANGTSVTLNMEFVYDIMKKKWYQVDRGTGKYLQLGITVRDANGNSYNYGFIASGYMERLEYGTTFDTTNITSTFRLADISLGDWRYLTKIRKLKHLAVAKLTTTQSVTISHYGDCSLTANSTTVTHAIKDTTKRTVRKVDGLNWGNYLFHSIQCSITTSNENVGYEPLGIEVKWQQIHDEEF